jgi:hypothetical protein
MALLLTKVQASDLCHGSDWAIDDQDALAEHVARIAVGQYRHVAKVLAGTGFSPPPSDDDVKADAIALLTAQDPSQPWHRDGWVFQAISWIAAHTGGGTAIRPPHLIKAHKGFDGLQLELAANGSVQAVIIFEDKATEHPRDTIRDDVLPGIVKLENGERRNELGQEVAALLETQLRAYPDLDVDSAVQQVVWKEARRYRVAITVASPHDGEVKRKSLFKDYDTSAPGELVRRGGDTMTIPDLREWMQSFSNLVIAKIKAMPADV